jgi:nucleoside-diphosphate-sugar epimerase
VSTAFTVLGGAGFVGSHLVRRVREAGHPCVAPGRDEPLPRGPLGHVVYCVGRSGDVRERPLDGVDADVTRFAALLRDADYTSLLYLSTTRVYDRVASSPAREDDELPLRPACSEDLHAASKLLGEGLALRAGGRVARLANVYGPGQQPHAFLATVLRQAQQDGRVVFESSLDSARDHVAVADVAEALMRIALRGGERIYNVASGTPVTNEELAAELVRLTGCDVQVRPQAPVLRRPRVDVSRLQDDLGVRPVALSGQLPGLLAQEASR